METLLIDKSKSLYCILHLSAVSASVLFTFFVDKSN